MTEHSRKFKTISIYKKNNIYKLFNETKNNIQKLEKHFFVKNSINQPTTRKRSFTKAYIVLAHAEIENLFENIFLKILDEEYKYWEKHRKAGLFLSYLFMWHNNEVSDKKNNNSKKSDNNYTDIINRAAHIKSVYQKIINNNHGIQEHYLRDILKPLGLKISLVPNTLLINLKTFSSYRNSIAHTSTMRINQEYNFNDIKNLIEQILKDIEELINNIINYHNSLL